jgi:hypothetical protein
LNAIQVKIDDNVKMLVELHARWEREDEMARNMTKVCTITTTSDVVSNASNPFTLIGVKKIPTPCAKKPKTAKSFSNKSAEIFRSMGDNSSTTFNDFDVDGCKIPEVILFLQKLALSPNANSMNVAFTKHITNAVMQIREEKLKQKVFIPKKLEDGWEPIIEMNVNDFDCETSQVFKVQIQHACIFIMASEIKFESNFKTRRLHFKEISFKAYVNQIEFSIKQNKFKCLYTKKTLLF